MHFYLLFGWVLAYVFLLVVVHMLRDKTCSNQKPISGVAP